jgi:hypothetical protein
MSSDTKTILEAIAALTVDNEKTRMLVLQSRDEILKAIKESTNAVTVHIEKGVVEQSVLIKSVDVKLNDVAKMGSASKKNPKPAVKEETASTTAETKPATGGVTERTINKMAYAKNRMINEPKYFEDLKAALVQADATFITTMNDDPVIKAVKNDAERLKKQATYVWGHLKKNKAFAKVYEDLVVKEFDKQKNSTDAKDKQSGKPVDEHTPETK